MGDDAQHKENVCFEGKLQTLYSDDTIPRRFMSFTCSTDLQNEKKNLPCLAV